ncbi:ABC transporter permease [Nocardioides ferulae]|uniref:ABC transporter permease n=1 Tax=Nocardioides ferulae TaxID=2340821 RepID=UPI000F872357|nr:ABC transporter permease [Nocardioides ferulae]
MSVSGGRFTHWWTGWRLALRVAARDARRARGRSILVLVMIALPVLAVTAADVVISTAEVNAAEGLDRRLGAADARVISQNAADVVEYQAPDPDDGLAYGGRRDGRRPTLEDVTDVLGGGRPAVSVRDGVRRVRTDAGVATAMAVETDLADPLTDGLARLTEGRWPRADDEVVVNQALLDRGSQLGGELELVTVGADDTRTIVGTAESTIFRDQPFVAAGPGALGLPQSGRDEWLLGGGPVSWSQVLDLNRLGLLVLSRAVVLDPPASTMADEYTGSDDAAAAVLALVVAMVLLEVVLLAGPAFAVGAKRQTRTLALMAASGGSPPQARRVVLGSAIVLGGLASLGGVGLGIGLGWALLPLAQRFSGEWFGPFQVPWLQLAGIASFGLVSALLAALVPAWIASRQDVVAVLGGRRGDRPPSRRSPLLGLLVLGAGVAGSAYGARADQNGEAVIAASAVVAVLGMIALVPVVVAAVARVAGRLPLPVRYAARDAARHRTRTVPAVAAVAATVAGVVALGIAVTSDEAENRGEYTASLPAGMGSVTATSGAPPDWAAMRRAAEAQVPDATVIDMRGVREGARGWTDLRFRHDDGAVRLSGWGSTMGSSILVGPAALPVALPDQPATTWQRAERVLADGGVLVFGAEPATGVDRLTVKAAVHPPRGRAERTSAVAPALVVPVTNGYAPFRAVLSDELAQELGLTVSPVGLLVDGDLAPADEERLSDAVGEVSARADVYVERGYQTPDETVIVQLVLAGLGALLMLGGTLTATFLALSDARPDLATLAAVGAGPRTRRAVAAAYALVVGLVGAVLGAAVGFVPGIAVTFPLTGRGWTDAGQAEGHYLDVPWLLVLGVVVALPLLTAAIVGLAARSRLPLASRLD